MGRFIDIVLSSVALIVLSPFFAVIMIILRFTGDGEVFFVQPRVGVNGMTFGLLKFVTMVKDAHHMADGVLTRKNDPRVYQ